MTDHYFVNHISNTIKTWGTNSTHLKPNKNNSHNHISQLKPHFDNSIVKRERWHSNFGNFKRCQLPNTWPIRLLAPSWSLLVLMHLFFFFFDEQFSYILGHRFVQQVYKMHLWVLEYTNKDTHFSFNSLFSISLVLLKLMSNFP